MTRTKPQKRRRAHTSTGRKGEVQLFYSHKEATAKADQLNASPPYPCRYAVIPAPDYIRLG